MAERKVVPERNALKATALTKEPVLLDGRKPGFHYEWKSTDPSHPSYVGKVLRKHEIGDADSGYAVVEPFEVVHRESDPGLALRNPRDDQGKPVDTVHRLGDCVLVMTPIENAAKYNAVHDAKVALNSKGLTDGEKKNFGTTSSSFRVVHDEQAAVEDVLKGIS